MAELIFALDVPDIEKARRFVEEIPELTFYKVGLELFVREGRDIIEYLKDHQKRIFLDLKFHDIPSTVAGAARQVMDMGVDVFNIHISGGWEMVKRSAEVVAEERAKREVETKIIGVTVLTSLGNEDIRRLGFQKNVSELVVELAKRGYEAGLDGVVCSPLEALNIKKVTSEEFLTFTPGISITGERRDDQKRVMSVRDAVENSCDYLIIGRPIRNSNDPRGTVLSILKQLV